MAKANPKTGRNGSKTAPPLLDRLSEPEFRERVRVTEIEMAALDKIASGEYVRNANAIISAIKIKIESAYSRQVQPVEVRDSRTRTVRFADGRPLTPAAAGLPASRSN